MAKLFRDSTHALIYSQFRPKPPQELINTIMDYLSEKLPSIEWTQAVDVGCGSGQATQPLAKHFKQVYGFDASSAQIKEAIRLNQFNNIEFKTSSAEEIPIDSNSVQLLTVCQSIHWFDLNKFFAEVNRVLTPKGVLALIGYRMPDISHENYPNDDRIKNLCQRFYCWPSLEWPKKERQLVDEGLASITLPFGDQLRKDCFPVHSSASAQDLRGYLKSWSAYNSLLKTDEQKAQIFLNSFDEEIKSIFGDKSFDEIVLKIQFNYYLLMCRK